MSVLILMSNIITEDVKYNYGLFLVLLPAVHKQLCISVTTRYIKGTGSG